MLAQERGVMPPRADLPVREAAGQILAQGFERERLEEILGSLEGDPKPRAEEIRDFRPEKLRPTLRSRLRRALGFRFS
jgi:hypothetical protein